MEKSSKKKYKSIDITHGDLLPILDAIDQGILMTNSVGDITHYNQSHAEMDGLSYDEVIGRNVTDVYELNEASSIVCRCLKIKKPIINSSCVYKARNGRVVTSLHNVFPLKKNDRLIGTISCVKDYEYLDGLINPDGEAPDRMPIVNETRFSFNDIVGSNAQMLSATNKARMASASPAPILLYGETGTGKELFAQSIHNFSPRKDSLYMAVNCAAIPETLLEGILFGTARGAFTGAIDKPGLLEQANGGTLFLDEINSMPISLQSKLLRVLQEKKVRRIGALKELNLDLKIISSVNVFPQVALKDGTMRKDLLYRLSVVYIPIPSLRERSDDIEALAMYFIGKHNRAMGKNVGGISENISRFFNTYQWLGNVRELENMIEGAMNMVGSETTIEAWHLSSFFSDGDNKSANTTIGEQENVPVDANWGIPGTDHGSLPIFQDKLSDQKDRLQSHTIGHLNRKIIEQALTASGGNVSKTAIALGVARQTLHQKIKKYGIDKKKIGVVFEKKKIETCLMDNHGNVTRTASYLGISRQLLSYKIKKYKINRT